jgi:CheY-like chemotaxis protein/anti-sigma regulatory factor (Ser/Thr protein kinase)
VKSIGFEVHVNFDKKVLADEQHINWILAEIIDNAIKFSHNGKIIISIDLNDNNLLAISVSDQGKGIAQELSAELTDSFRQEEEEFNRSHDGLGIGLSITSELVKLLVGKLSIHTSEEFSTCIVIELPIVKSELATTQAPKKSFNRNQKPLTILIIEDNKVNQIILEKILKKLGYNIIVSNDGIEGYKAAQGSQFDLILIDCKMPNMDGFECTQLIRKSDNINRDTLITANASEANKERCLNSGMNDFRNKPIEPFIIKELLDEYFV